MVLRSTALALAACGLLTFAAPSAQAQLPISLRVSAVAGVHQADVTATAGGAELGTASTTMYTAGAEITLGLPIGLDVGAHYLRHIGDASDALGQDLGTLNFGLGANELGVFVENRYALLPMSPVKPFVGIGAGYGRISLSQDLDLGDAAASALDGSISVFRLYALGGFEIFGGLGLKVRGGYMFGSIDGEDLSFGQTYTTPGGQEVGFELDYGGAYASAALSLFGF